MIAKSLTVAAFILGLGVITACDDPEVQGKVAEVMQYGSVSAKLHCENVDFGGLCGNNPTIDLFAYRFIDGANYIKVNTEGPHAQSVAQFNSNDESLEARSKMPSTGEFSFVIEDGTITMTSGCTPSPPWTNYVSVDLSLESCTGRNIEAFGITP